MKALEQCRLYTFVDTAYLHGRAATEVAQALCVGGSDIIQLRAKDESKAVVQQLAEALLPITRKHDVGLVINDYPDIARNVGAPLCHLGQDDFGAFASVRELNQAYDADVKLGLSSHEPAQAERAMSAGAAYIAVGPVFKTPTKPAAKPVTLEYVRWAAANITVPWFAIGGITLDNVDQVLAAGARRICVVSAILNQPDIAAACRNFKERLLSQSL